MEKKIKVEIKVVNESDRESTETYWMDFDKLFNKDWDRVVKDLLSEAVEDKEF